MTEPDVWDERVAGFLAGLRRRLTGDYEVDDFGFDRELTESVFLPLLRPLYRNWFRVEATGAKQLPEDGPALVVANHSGPGYALAVIAMLAAAISAFFYLRVTVLMYMGPEGDEGEEAEEGGREAGGIAVRSGRRSRARASRRGAARGGSQAPRGRAARRRR